MYIIYITITEKIKGDEFWEKGTHKLLYSNSKSLVKSYE